jgi:hypothetical protein
MCNNNRCASLTSISIAGSLNPLTLNLAFAVPAVTAGVVLPPMLLLLLLLLLLLGVEAAVA